jgi:hypothetical protein
MYVVVESEIGMLKLYKKQTGEDVEVPITKEIVEKFQEVLHAARIVHHAGVVPPTEQQRYLDYRMGFLGARLDDFNNLFFKWED